MLESASGWGTLIIFAGIVAEIFAFFLISPGDPKERLASLIANALIAIGLVIEYVAIRLTIIASGEAKLEADGQIAAANARAAEANQKAQEAALELAKYREPRRSTQEQMYRIAEKLKPLAPMQYAGATVGRDPEFLTFLQFIEATLILADWQEIGWHVSAGMTRGAGRTVIGTSVSVSNVLITFPLSQMGLTLENAAVALAEALTAEGFIASAGMDSGPNAQVIHVMVGPKT